MVKLKELLEEEQLNEFLGSLVKAIFKTKATKLGASFFANPVIGKAFQEYIDDTKKFKEKMKRQGISNERDLKKAIRNNPAFDGETYDVDWE